ncbi:uncharacterized protein SPPG_05047 [Spizellomyces punctatus DAOM BR117]|uniref:HCP-like protein n=1 Tax=Spizellomyces punctatus (strain DAOM BR117) TaxID=645134 RepID=A0A0L0HF53_SPIPD|nr:uncharacterized protein SPPG_05047 [Spizellomyces punctatus DAOM BR117]KNC99666.1 hypothetical protein SPPG_05047 [Spizellomyces punctatus DAOM BR117]|eukprot:XP_016607706.1 hypothetical protein SPPG_05047 [Spizellomyces punctatus DAOM BR117]
MDPDKEKKLDGERLNDCVLEGLPEKQETAYRKPEILEGLDPHIALACLPSPLPSPPAGVDINDPLQLGIHYHDTGDMSISAHYLSISARQGHAVGMYLFAMALRHGWGCTQDMPEAVRLFERAAGIVLEALPRLQVEGADAGTGFDWGSGAEGQIEKNILPSLPEAAEEEFSRRHSITLPSQSPPLSRAASLDRLPSQSSGSSSEGEYSPESPLTATSPPISPTTPKWKRFSLASLTFPSLRRASTGSPNVPSPITLQSDDANSPSPPSPLTRQLRDDSNRRRDQFVVARSFLPLPLYEVGVCYHQGWGVPKSKSTALYYFQLAAQLGDADAQAEVGYLYLRGGNGVKRDKKRAARWLREAVKGGKRIVGEQWIWKEKWAEGGDGGQRKWGRRKKKRESAAKPGLAPSGS